MTTSVSVRRRILLSLVSILCVLCSFMICEVNATTIEDIFVEERDNTFIDVLEESKYYDAVEYLVDKGVVKGCGNGKFNPDSNITLNHFAIMLIRAFDDIKYEDRPLPICFNNRWIDMETVKQEPNSTISRGAVYKSLLTVKRISVFSEKGGAILWSDYAKVVSDLVGLSEENLIEGITRGEVAQLFYYFMNNEVVIELPNILKDIVFINETQNIGEYEKMFEKIPTIIVDEFNRQGWQIDLTNKNFLKYKEEWGGVANGLCDYANKTISLKTPASLIHEFGHFIDYISDDTLGIEELFDNESSIIEEYKGYQIDNSREYFAEYFVIYIYAKTDIEKLEFLKTFTPQTFEYFVELEENNWGIK